MELTEDKLKQELKNNKSLREIAEKYDTNLSHVFNLKEKSGLDLLNSVIESGQEKRLTVSSILDEMGMEDAEYWGYKIKGNSLVIDFYDNKLRSED